ncbi:293_t:CDS:1, partial [Cetraspora pellucida]
EFLIGLRLHLPQGISYWIEASPLKGISYWIESSSFARNFLLD